jgi:hypothetical protein
VSLQEILAMDALFAFCITILFSFWIWDLKRELNELRRRRTTTGPAIDPRINLPGHDERHHGSHVPPAPRPHGCPPPSGGIPTWTIE